MEAVIHVLLVDDHAMFREGLARLLLELDASTRISHAGSCEQALACLHWAQPPVQLIVLDLMLPGLSGIDGLAALRDGWPEVPVVVLSGRDDAQSVKLAIDAGAMAFVSKTAAPGVLARALETVMRGGLCLPEMPGVSVGAATAPVLTPRQWEVLYLLLQGLPNKRIAQSLGLAPPTVKAHVGAVLRALGVTTRTQAVIAASRLKLGWRGTAVEVSRSAVSWGGDVQPAD